MNSIFQLILLSIFVAYQVHSVDDKDKEIKKSADEFYSTVIEKLREPLKCPAGHVDGQDQFLNGLCHIVNKMKPILEHIKETQEKQATFKFYLHLWFSQLTKTISDDFGKFKKLILKKNTLNEEEQAEMNKTLSNCSKAFRPIAIGKDGGNHENAKEKSDDHIQKAIKVLSANEIKCLLEILNKHITNLKVLVEEKNGKLEEKTGKLLAAQCIFQLENIIGWKKAKGQMALEDTALEVFKVELLVYAMKIPLVHEKVKEMNLHIHFH